MSFKRKLYSYSRKEKKLVYFKENRPLLEMGYSLTPDGSKMAYSRFVSD